METTEQNPSNITQESLMQQEPIEPAKENIFKRILGRVIGIILFLIIASVLAYIIVTLRVGSTH